MIEGLPPWQRRLLAVLMLCTAVSVGWSVLFLPVLTIHRNHQEWRSSTLEALARYRALAAHRQAFEKARDQLDADPAWQRLYATADTAVASAELQGDLTRLYDPQKIMVQLVQSLEPVTEQGITRVGVRMAFTASIDQLAAFFAAVEAAPKLLRIDEVNVTSPEYQEGGANPVLSARVDIWGYLHPRLAAP